MYTDVVVLQSVIVQGDVIRDVKHVYPSMGAKFVSHFTCVYCRSAEAARQVSPAITNFLHFRFQSYPFIFLLGTWACLMF